MSKVVKSIVISRRSLLQAVAGAVPVLALTTQTASAKIAQSAVAYQAEPKGDNKCSNCNLFEAPAGCKTVDGTVSENGWCKIWVKKAG